MIDVKKIKWKGKYSSSVLEKDLVELDNSYGVKGKVWCRPSNTTLELVVYNPDFEIQEPKLR